MNKLTPERLEQLKYLRYLLDHIEAGGIVEVNRGWPAQPVWDNNGALAFLDRAPWFRIAGKPVDPTYTVDELVEKGIRFLYLDYKVYMVLLLNLKANTITVSQLPNLPNPSYFPPSWFAERKYQWSADGREWKSFTKED